MSFWDWLFGGKKKQISMNPYRVSARPEGYVTPSIEDGEGFEVKPTKPDMDNVVVLNDGRWFSLKGAKAWRHPNHTFKDHQAMYLTSKGVWVCADFVHIRIVNTLDALAKFKEWKIKPIPDELSTVLDPDKEV